MPMYADRTNAENKIKISEASRHSIPIGPEKVISRLADAIVAKGKTVNVALESWLGVPDVAKELALALQKRDY